MSKFKRFIHIGLLSFFLLSSLHLVHRPILIGMGEFLAPCKAQEAEVVILEGSQIVNNDAIAAGLKLLFDGKAKRLVLIIHQPLNDDQLIALREKCAQLLMNESDRIGLQEKFQIMVVPFSSHPITLNEARFVVTRLSQEGITSAILLSKGFHTRRSYAVYRQQGARVGLRVIPSSYFNEYKNDNWWQCLDGVQDFLEQSVKLTYYLMWGYVSIKSLG